MGIDPVTHSPRLDLLDLSSILSSSLYNSSTMNISRFLGVQPLVNPELLRLATSLMSSNRENPNFLLQNVQENQLCNAHGSQFRRIFERPPDRLSWGNTEEDRDDSGGYKLANGSLHIIPILLHVRQLKLLNGEYKGKKKFHGKKGKKG